MLRQLITRIYVFFAACLILLSAACSGNMTVGLGASVDTEAPSVSISYPPASAIITGSFVVSGSCKDDKSVKRVTVTLSGHDTGRVYGPAEASLNANGTEWSITINPADCTLLDDTYTVSFTAYDDAGHSTAGEGQTIYIDNTAPVFIVSNPGVVISDDTDTYSAYGSLFNIQGTASDYHNVASMEVSVYDNTDSSLITTITENNISTSGTASVNIAQWIKSPSSSQEELKNNYETIYGSYTYGTKAQSKYYFCSIRLTDNARIYNNPAYPQGIEGGNSTSVVYLYDDVYETLLSPSKGLGLSASDFVKVLNGVSSNQTVLSVLTEKARNTSELNNCLGFSLNPAANPTYDVSGFNITEVTDSTTGCFITNDFEAGSGSQSLNVSISAGLDGINIPLSSVKIWLLTDGTVNNSVDTVTSAISRFTSGVYAKDCDEDKLGIYLPSLWDYKRIIPETSLSGSSVSSKNISFKIPDGISNGKAYYIVVTGEDLDSFIFSQTSIYGFRGTSSGTAPSVSITYPSSSSYASSFEGLNFTGTAVIKDGTSTVSGVDASILVTHDSGNEYTFTAPSVLTADDGSWTFAAGDFKDENGRTPVEVINESGTTYKYTLTVNAESALGVSAKAERTAVIDTELPEVSITTVTGSVDGSDYTDLSGIDGSSVYVNGKVIIKATVSDSYISNVSWTVYVDGKAVSSHDFGKVSSINSDNEIDTTLYTDQKSFEVVITAEDLAGNKSEYSTKKYNEGKNYIIDQRTDKPVITLTNADVNIGISDIRANANLFGVTSNNRLTGTVKDDDTLSHVDIYLYDTSDNYLSSSKNDTYKSSYSINYSLPEDEGTYKILVRAYDSSIADTIYTNIVSIKDLTNLINTTTTDSLKSSCTDAGPFYIAVSKGAPSVSVTAVEDYYSSTVSLSGTAGESASSVTIKAVNTQDSSEAYEAQTVLNNGSWSGELDISSAPDGSYTLTVTACDSYQQTNDVSYSFIKDTASPVISITDVSSYVNSANVKISGSVSDLSSVTVSAQLFTEGGQEISLTDNTVTASKNGSWSLPLYDLEDNSYYVVITAVDGASNTSEKKGSIFTVDTHAPVISAIVDSTLYDINASSLRSSSVESGSTYYTPDSSYSILLTVDEANPDKLISDSGVLNDNEDGTYSLSVSNLSDGTHTYKFTATDKAGSKSVFNLSLITDSTPPSVSLSNLSEGGFVSSASVVVSGNITDTGIGSDKVYYKVTKADGTRIYPSSASQDTYAVSDASSSSWKTSEISFTDEGSLVFTYYAQDKIGIQSTPSEVSFSYDASAPVVTETVINTSSRTVNGSYTFGGTASDTNSIASVTIKDNGTVAAVLTPEGSDVKQFDYTYTVKDADLKDGSHVYTITACDIAGRTNDIAVTRTINVDTTPPVAGTPSFKNSVTALDESVYNTVSVTAEDEGTLASGIAGVHYALTDSMESPSLTDSTVEWTSLAQGASAWNANIDFTGKDEGSYYAWIKVTDNAGNEALSSAPAVTVVDKTAPVAVIGEGSSTISLNASSATQEEGKDTAYANLIVTLTDTNPVSITYEYDSNSPVTVTEASSVTLTGKTYIVPVKGIDTTGERTTTVKVYGTDANGRVSPSVKVVVDCDTQSPSATINTTGTDGFVTSNAVTLSGTALDAHLKSVTVSYYNTEDISSPVETKTFDSAQGEAWSWNIYGLTEATYYAEAVAEDSYGNSTVVNGNRFTVDTISPVNTVTITSTGTVLDTDYNVLTGDSGIYLLTDGNTYYVSGSYTLTGNCSDTNIDSITAVNADVEGKSFISQTVSEDGKTVYEITSRDKAGNITLTKVTVVVDTTPPSVNVTSPSGYISNSSLSIIGTAVETGSGIAEITYYIEDNLSKQVASGSVNVNGSNWSVSSVDITGAEGQYTLYVTARDNMGLQDNKSAAFYYDESAPVINVNDFDVNYTNSLPVISGTAYDTNELKSIVITDSESSLEWTIDLEEDAEASVPDGKAYTLYTWSKTLDGISQGKHSFTAVACDVVNKTSKESKSVTYDTASPVINGYSVTTESVYTDTDGNSWYGTGTISVKVNVQDLYGIESVTYNAGENSGTLSKNGSEYTGSIICSLQGLNEITVTVTDKAGNTASDVMSVWVDTKAADSVSVVSVDGISSYTNTNGVNINIDEDYTKLTNGSDSITVVLSAGDSASGVKCVSLKKIGSSSYSGSEVSFDDKATASLVITKDQIASARSGALTVTVTDNAGNTADFALFNIELDVTKPKITISSVNPYVSGSSFYGSSDTDKYLNGTVSVSGNVVENNLSDVYYDVEINGTVKEAISGKSISVSDDQSFTFVIQLDTTAEGFTDESTINVVITATDKAGNSSTESTTSYNGGKNPFIISQDTDRPVLTFTNVNLTETQSQDDRIWIYSSPILATAADDDGIALIEWSSDGVNYKALDGTSSVKMTFDSRTLSDGNHELYFRITDKEGKVFTSDGEANTDAVILCDGNGVTLGKKGSDYKSPVLYVTVDTTSPIVNIEGVSLDNGASFTDTYSNLTLGGSEYTDLTVKMSASDANGISSVVLTSKYTDSNDTEHVLETVNGVTGDDGCYYAKLSSASLNAFTGTMIITATATDNASLTATANKQLAVDNTEPVIVVTGPSSSTAQTGGVTVYGTVDSMQTMYYAVSTSDTVKPGNAVTSWYDDDGTKTALSGYTPSYKIIEDAGISWFVYFDGDTDTSASGTHTATLNSYLVNYGITDNASIENGSFDSIVKMYIWIKAVDSVGNETEYCHPVILDPQGDKPSVAVTYPADGSSLGGKIKAYGTVSDTKGSVSSKIGVDHVWMQIISTQHEYALSSENTFGTLSVSDNMVRTFEMTSGDLDYLAESGYDVYNMKDFESTDTSVKWTSGDSRGSEQGFKASDYGVYIKVSGSAWSVNLNSNGEFKPSTGTNDIGIRFYAQDLDGKFSSKSDVYCKFDASNPVLGGVQPLYLVQSSSVAYSESATASREYTEDMYVKGSWYLTGSIEDDDGINELSIGNDTLIEDGVVKTSPSWSIIEDTVTDNNETTHVKYFKYKLDTSSGVGSLSLRIYAEDLADGTKNTTTKTLYINYDNVAPVLAGTADSGYALNPKIVQSNNFYSLGSKVSESVYGTASQSGLNYVAFWFMRRNITGDSETDTVYNVKRARGSNTVTVDSKVRTIAQYESSSDKTDKVVYDSGIYWYPKSVSRDSENLSVITLSEEDENIAAGGLVKTGGSLYLISSVNGNTVTLNGNPPSQYTTVYFANAVIVNNTVQENGSGTPDAVTGYYASSDISNDDGDGIVEAVKKSGTNWTWSAEIVSKNIPDGPVELHYVAFDVAGNYSVGIMGNWDEEVFSGSLYEQTPDRSEYSVYADRNSTFTTTTSSYAAPAFISNNAPRLAGVKIGTDINGTDSIDLDNEWNNAYAGKYTSYAKAVSSLVVCDEEDSSRGYVTTKGYTAIIPEILGGNNAVYYEYDFRTSEGSYTGTPYRVTSPLADGNIGGDAELLLNEGIVLQTGDFLRLNIAETDISSPEWFKIKIWDSTEGTEVFTDSQSATVEVALGIAVRDITSPRAQISEPVVVDGEGHVESTSSWKNAPGYTNASSGEYDGDVKVSGKIMFTGSVADENILSGIYLSSDEFSNVLEQSGLDKKTAGSMDYYRLASYSAPDSKWTTYSADGISLEINSNTFTSEDHIVDFTITVDTVKCNNVTDTDVKLYVMCTDRGQPDLTAQSESQGLWTYTYSTVANNSEATVQQMDIVPYITGITRPSTDDNPVTTYRSRYGKNPVKVNEVLSVTGYNFKNNMTAAVGTVNAAVTYNNDKSASLTVPDNSGELTVCQTTGTRSIYSLNNVNNDSDESNTESDAGYSVRIPDARYLSVWDTDHTVAGSGSVSLMPSFDFDNTGVIYTSWTQTGKSSVELVRGISNAAQNETVFVCYDQPRTYSAIGVEKSTGNMGITMFPDHVGNGGIFSSKGIANNNIVGGAGFIAVNKDSQISAIIDYNDKTSRTPVIASGTSGSDAINPMIGLDGNVSSPYYPIATHEFTRNPSSFSAPQTARYGNYGHSLFYDETTGGLKYVLTDISTDNTYNTAQYDSNKNYNDGQMFDVTVIDGPSEGYDRQHATSKGSKSGFYSFGATADNVEVGIGTAGYYQYDYPYQTPASRVLSSGTVLAQTTATLSKGSNRTVKVVLDDSYRFMQNYTNASAYTLIAGNTTFTPSKVTFSGATATFTIATVSTALTNVSFTVKADTYAFDSSIEQTSAKITFASSDWKNIINTNGATLAFFDSSNPYDAFETRTAKSVSWSSDNLTAIFTFDKVDTTYDKVTVWAGHKTTAGSRDSLTNASSAGEYSSIDVSGNGYPVIMYRAGTKLRLAYAVSKAPQYTDWVRQETNLSGGQYVSLKLEDDGLTLHAVYKSGSCLKYVKATRTSETSDFTFGESEDIDTDGSLSMSTLSLYGKTPVVTYMNDEGEEDGVKYAKRITLSDGSSAWDYMVVPAVDGYYPSSNNYRVYVGANPAGSDSASAVKWSTTQDGVAMGDCEAFVGYKTSRADVVFIKAEK